MLTTAHLQSLELNIEQLLDASVFTLSTQKPSEWAEEHRVMTSDVSPFPGRFNYNRTPYLREIVDTLSPNHPARIIAIMKGAQIGFSTGVIESGIGYIISQQPGNILFLSGHQELSEEAMNTKIDQMIDSCGLRQLIRPSVIRKKNMRTGDTSQSKEFPGGRLVSGSANNHKLLRQRSVRYGFIDDFEAVRGSSKESGDTTKMIEQRFAAYGDQMKLYYISTPEKDATSNIKKVYELGDKRKWHIPCPCCGSFIALEWTVPMKKNPEEKGGITWKLDSNNKLVEDSVGYLCQECGDFFTDARKHELNLAGQWIPTAEPSQMGYYSYHLSSLYAPVGMYDWKHYVRDYLAANPVDAPQKVGLQQAFDNLCLGLTFAEESETPTANLLEQFNIRSYEVGQVPEELSVRDGNGSIVLLTCAADLNGLVDDARLDYEVVGWAESGASYSITHGSIGTFIPRENTLKVKEDREPWSYKRKSAKSVWAEFDKLMETLFDTGTDRKMRIHFTGVDTGYCEEQAYDYIDNWQHGGRRQFVVGLKGDKEATYVRSGIDLPTFKIGKARTNLYIVQGPVIKDDLAELMKLRWQKGSGEPQPSGFMNYPTPSGGLYLRSNFFSHYEAEHRVAEVKAGVAGTKWEKKSSNSQNHLWDCRVYNHALRDIVVYETAKMLKIPNGKMSWKEYVDVVMRRG